MYRTKIYEFACVYIIFSRFIQTETQFIHFASVCISEKGEGGERVLGEWRARFGRVASEIWKRGERGTKMYVFIQFSLFYTIRNNFYTLVFV